jgi:hypothetical protein
VFAQNVDSQAAVEASPPPTVVAAAAGPLAAGDVSSAIADVDSAIAAVLAHLSSITARLDQQAAQRVMVPAGPAAGTSAAAQELGESVARLSNMLEPTSGTTMVLVGCRM